MIPFTDEGLGAILQIQSRSQVCICEGDSEEKFVLKRSTVETLTCERNVLQTLKGVSHIAQIFEEMDGKICNALALQYYCNGDLHDFMEKHGIFSEILAKTLFFQILTGVKNIHMCDVVHRDIKPENLFLDRDMKIHIGDFGAADIIDTAGTNFRVTGLKGTPFFYAPELFTEVSFDGRKTDSWMCGCTFFIMLTKHDPFLCEGSRPDSWFIQTLKVGRTDLFWNWHEKHYLLSRGAKELLEKCFVIDPRARASVSELLVDPWLNEGLLTDEEVCEAMQTLIGDSASVLEI